MGVALSDLFKLAMLSTVFVDCPEGWGLAEGNPPFGKMKDTPQLRARFDVACMAIPICMACSSISPCTWRGPTAAWSHS